MIDRSKLTGQGDAVGSGTGISRQAWRLVALLATWALLAPGLTSANSEDLPTLGDGSSAIISPAMEKRIGREFLKQINAVVPTVDDPILKYYVDRHIDGDILINGDMSGDILADADGDGEGDITENASITIHGEFNGDICAANLLSGEIPPGLDMNITFGPFGTICGQAP